VGTDGPAGAKKIPGGQLLPCPLLPALMVYTIGKKWKIVYKT